MTLYKIRKPLIVKAANNKTTENGDVLYLKSWLCLIFDVVIGAKVFEETSFVQTIFNLCE